MNIFVNVIVGCLVMGTWAIAAGAADSKQPKQQLDAALANLRNSDAEWRREYALYRAQRGSNALSPAEADEYAEFVASLHKRKLEDCETVRKIGGDDALEGLDCIKLDRSRTTVASLPPAHTTARTEFEKLEALEHRLKRLEAELDEELLRKQRLYRQRARNSAGRGGAGSPSARTTVAASRDGGADPAESRKAGNRVSRTEVEGPSSETGFPSETETKNRAKENKQQAATSRKRTGNFDPGAGPGTEKNGKPGSVARGAPEDGRGDDVVMRQIREAAERESDPVLKRKLWAEYQKLKAAR